MITVYQRKKGIEQFGISCSPQHAKLQSNQQLSEVRKKLHFSLQVIRLQNFSLQEIIQSKVNNAQLF